MTKDNWFQRAERFVRDYTGGVGAGDLRRLFDRDAAHAFGVVTREHEGAEPKGKVGRFFHRAKILFLGLSFKLSPPRRVLFGVSIVLSLLALQNFDSTMAAGGQFAFFHLVGIAGLVFLILLELADRIIVRDELEVARELQHDLLDPATGRIDYVIAGHPYPMLRRSDGEIVELGEGGIPLGIREELSSPTGEVTIEPGDQLLLYTDGIAETLDPSGDDYGYDRLRRALEIGGSATAIHNRIVREMVSFQGEASAHDDRSLMVVTRSVPLPPLPGSDSDAPLAFPETGETGVDRVTKNPG